MIFSNLNSNCSSLLDLRNLQEQVKNAFCYQKLFLPFTVWIDCSSDLKNFVNSQPSASNFKSFSRSQEQFFLTADQNNFGNKIPFTLFLKVWTFFLNPLFPHFFFYFCSIGVTFNDFKTKLFHKGFNHNVPYEEK